MRGVQIVAIPPRLSSHRCSQIRVETGKIARLKYCMGGCSTRYCAALLTRGAAVQPRGVTGRVQRPAEVNANTVLLQLHSNQWSLPIVNWHAKRAGKRESRDRMQMLEADAAGHAVARHVTPSIGMFARLARTKSVRLCHCIALSCPRMVLLTHSIKVRAGIGSLCDISIALV